MQRDTFAMISNRRDVFVNQRRINKRIVPGKMPGHPITNDGRELTNLRAEPAVLPGRDPQCIFIEPDLRSGIRGIKSAIETRLNEKINLRTDLSVEKQTEPRAKKGIAAAIDQARRWLVEMIQLQVERAA